MSQHILYRVGDKHGSYRGWPSGRPRPPQLIRWIPASILLAFIIVPLGALCTYISFAALRAALGSVETHQALLLSLQTSSIAALLVLLLGTPLAYGLARDAIPLRGLLDIIVELPVVLPPAVAGVALLIALGPHGFVGGWLQDRGVTLVFSTPAVVLAQMFVASPFYVRAARSAFSSGSLQLEEAAATLGSRPLRTFILVTVPLAFPALLGGLVLTWARALGEFGATILFAGNMSGITRTMPLAIYASFEGDGDLAAAVALAVVLIGISFFVLASVRLVERIAGHT